jgi:hypothetical protein
MNTTTNCPPDSVKCERVPRPSTGRLGIRLLPPEMVRRLPANWLTAMARPTACGTFPALSQQLQAQEA